MLAVLIAIVASASAWPLPDEVAKANLMGANSHLLHLRRFPFSAPLMSEKESYFQGKRSLLVNSQIGR